MRAKPTFKDGVRTELKSTYWGDDYARPDDADLDPELAEIIVEWRGTFALSRPLSQDEKETLRKRGTFVESRPASQDVEETLRKLPTLDDEHIVRAAKCIDPWTESELCRLPSNPTPDQIRDEARRGRRSMTAKNGRRPGHMDSVWFGVALTNWWIKHKGRPTVTTNRECSKASEFLKWAVEMFHRAGRAVGEEAVAKIMREAIDTLDTLKNRIK